MWRKLVVGTRVDLADQDMRYLDNMLKACLRQGEQFPLNSCDEEVGK